MIGGGEGSQIGPAHRLGAIADGRFELVAAAFDHRPAKGKAFAALRLPTPQPTARQHLGEPALATQRRAATAWARSS